MAGLGGRRTLVELLHMLAGVVATAVIANLAAWSVPNAATSIFWVAWGAAAVVIYWGVRPLRAAWDADRQAMRPRDIADE